MGGWVDGRRREVGGGGDGEVVKASLSFWVRVGLGFGFGWGARGSLVDGRSGW